MNMLSNFKFIPEGDTDNFPLSTFNFPLDRREQQIGSLGYSLLRMILPLMVLGRSLRNSTMRGYL